MNEKEKMLSGQWYDANFDTVLCNERVVAQDICFTLNQTRPKEEEKRKEILNTLLSNQPKELTIISPFICDYGKYITFGDHVFVNSNCYFMDGGKITIGDYVFIGPSCGFYTGHHPLQAAKRNQGFEKALPITVGNHCWFGANVSVMPGVSIGHGCVIAAGSVVTKSVPDNVLIAGVPAKVIKTIDQEKEENNLL